MQNTRELTSGILFNQLIVCVLFLVLRLLSLDQSVKFDLVLITNLIGLAEHLVICFVYCNFSENVTQISVGVVDVMYDSTWYTLPINFQKLLILMLMRSEKEFRLKGAGMIDCSLATFLAVRIFFFHLVILIKIENNFYSQIIRRSNSYYLVLCQLK